MYKKIKKPLLCLLFITVFMLVAACSVKYETQDSDFIYNYNEAFSSKPENGYEIDGILSEEVWENKNYYILNGENYSFKLTTHFSDMGLYVAVIISDGIYYRQSSNFKTNTSFNIKFKVTDNGSIFDYSADLVNGRRSTCATMKSKLEGKINSDKANMTFEMYTTWASMGINEKPTKIIALPIYHRIQNEFDMIGTDLKPAFSQQFKTSLYLDFNENGLIQADKETAVLGDSGFGVTKSGGWNVSSEDMRIVKSYKRDYQAIFFKNAFYDSYIIEAKITPIGGINDADPRLGLMSYVDFNTWKATMLYGKASNLKDDGKDGKRFVSNAMSSLTFYPDGDWHWADVAKNTATADEYINGLTLKMVKVKDLFLYIINDKLKYSEQVSYLSDKTLAGFYCLGMEAVFSDYKIVNLENDSLATSKELLKYGYALDISRTPGGSIISDKVFINAIEPKVTLNVCTASGYEFVGLTHNSLDIFSDTVKALNPDGTFTLSEIETDVKLHFSFAKIDKNQQNLVSGIVTDSSGKIMNNSNVIIYDSIDKHNTYRVITDVNGKYTVTLFKNKNYNIAIDGGVNYHIYNGNFTSSSNSATEQNIEIVKKVVGGFANGLSGEPNYWDLSREEDGVIKANNTTNGRPIFFTDFAVENALIKAKIKYSLVAGGDTEPAAGFAIGNGYAISRIMIMKQGIRILRRGDWGQGDLTDLYDITNEYNFGGAQASEVTFVMLRKGVNYYLFTENNGNLKYFYTICLDTIKGKAAFGFVTTSGAEVDLEFSDYSIKELSNDEANTLISSKTMFDTTISTSANGDVSISNYDAGKVFGGAQTIAITPNSGYVVTKFKINGIKQDLGTIENGSYIVKHIFNASATIDVEFMKSVTASGKVKFNENNYSKNWNLSNTNIVFSSVDYADIYTTVNAQGDYNVELLGGVTYEITASHANASERKQSYATTSEMSQTIQDITLGLAKANGSGKKPDGSAFNWDKNWVNDNGRISSATSGDSASIISGGKGSKFIVEATFTKLGKAEWAGGGFRFSDGNIGFNVFLMKDALMISNNTYPDWESANETMLWGAINLNNASVVLRVIKHENTYYVLDCSNKNNMLLGIIDNTKTQLNQYSKFALPSKDCYVGFVSNCGGENIKDIIIDDVKFIADEAIVDMAVKNELNRVQLNASYVSPPNGWAPSGDKDWVYDTTTNSWSCPVKSADNGGKSLVAGTMNKRYIAEATFTSSTRLPSVGLVFKDNKKDNASYIGLFGWGIDVYPSFDGMDASGSDNTTVTIKVVKDTYLDANNIERNVFYVFLNGVFNKRFGFDNTQTVPTLKTLETCFGISIKGAGHQNVKVTNIVYNTKSADIEALIPKN